MLLFIPYPFSLLSYVIHSTIPCHFVFCNSLQSIPGFACSVLLSLVNPLSLLSYVVLYFMTSLFCPELLSLLHPLFLLFCVISSIVHMYTLPFCSISWLYCPILFSLLFPVLIVTVFSVLCYSLFWPLFFLSYVNFSNFPHVFCPMLLSTSSLITDVLC
jgi:hypothetical protein